MIAAPFDRVVTSPPYANRVSCMLELRPRMYWQEFLVNGRDAGELSWLAIGGTWGIATSRLGDWEPQATRIRRDLERTLANLGSPNNANGPLLATCIRKHCVDIAVHFHELRAILAPGGSTDIVGRSDHRR